MARPPKVSQRAVAELVSQVGRIAHGDGFVEGLTPAQWTALRYFSRANRFSRTVSAFAEFHSTTRGTASQTIKSLVNKGYLTRKRSEKDRRSARFDLTDNTLALLASDPFESIVTAAGLLSSSSRQVISRGLERMLRALVEQHGKRAFGMCPNCKYLSRGVCCSSGAPEYQCKLLREALTEAEIDQLCINFEPTR